jgi:fibronectin type 3 domain-containing protein
VGQAPFVDVVWSPDTEADLAGYNIFRHQENQPPVKLNSEPVKTPSYRDSQVQGGKKYYYSVSAIDERNNESAKSEEASEQVP